MVRTTRQARQGHNHFKIAVPFVTVILLSLMGGMMSHHPGTFISRTPAFDKTINCSHDPISINGNSELATIASQGNGTQENPYIIRDYTIFAVGTSPNGIFVTNTNAWFVIANCTITNASTGIQIYFSSNGRIENCTIIDSGSNGISCTHADNIVMADNILLHNNWGIKISNSNNNTISGNTVKFSSSFSCAIDLFGSKNATIENNEVQVGPTLINLDSCENCTIKGNIIHDADHYGLYIDFSSNISIIDNDILSCGQAGVNLRYSHNNTITGNEISWHRWRGFEMYECNSSILSGNRIAFNNEIGIDMQNLVYDCTYTRNSFIGNGMKHVQISTGFSGTVNWDNGSHASGNLWGDYESRYPAATNDGQEWNLPYAIDALGTVYDNHPLYSDTTPQFIIRSTVSSTVEIGETTNVSVFGHLGNGPTTREWFLDGQPVGSGNSMEHVFTKAGTYTISVQVTDADGDVADASIQFRVIPSSYISDWLVQLYISLVVMGIPALIAITSGIITLVYFIQVRLAKKRKRKLDEAIVAVSRWSGDGTMKLAQESNDGIKSSFKQKDTTDDGGDEQP